MSNKLEQIKRQIEAINDEGRFLTPWEQNFMESVTEQFDRQRSLSSLQEETLERIYNERVK